MEMMQENRKIKAKITPINNRSLRPTRPSSGIEGMLTPPSKRMVVLGMGTSVGADWNGCRAIHFFTTYGRRTLFRTRDCGESGNNRTPRQKTLWKIYHFSTDL